MAIPKKDSDLAAWSINFNTRITATPVTFGLTAGQATAYTTLHAAFIAAYNAASADGARSKSLVTAKETAKAALLVYARELYGFVQANTTVSDADKNLLGVTVKAAPTPVPPPSDPPALDIVSVTGRTVRIRLHDSTDASRRGKPVGVNGAAVFSFVGATPPSGTSTWKFEGNTGKTLVDVTFPDSVAPGAQVWLCAFWFNQSKQSGPACDPMSTNVQFGSAMAA